MKERKKENHDKRRPKPPQHLVGGNNGLESLALSWPLLSTRFLNAAHLLRRERLRVRVQPEKDLFVLERVLLEHTSLATLLLPGTTLGRADNSLHFRRVDQATNVGVADDVGREEVVLLESRGGRCSAVDGIQGVERGLGPDDEATEMATGGELQKVQCGDRGGLDTRDIAEGLNNTSGALVGGVNDDERATALAVATASQFTLTGAELAGLGDFDNVRIGTNGLQKSNGRAGLLQSGESGVGDDKREFRDRGNTVTTSLDERGNGRRCERGGSRETALALVNFYVPLAPDLGGREHAAGTALIPEGGLTSTVGTTTRDTGNTGNSTT